MRDEVGDARLGSYHQAPRAFDRGLALGIARAAHVWSGWRPGRLASLWRHYRTLRRGARRRARLLAQEGLVVPPVLIFSPTMRCNLSCGGCYSRDYPGDGEMSLHQIEALFEQAEDLGTTVFVITGGEPLLREGLMDLLSQHRDLLFLLFTNATFIDGPWVEAVSGLDHIVPVLSVEGQEVHTDGRRGPGTHRKVMQEMASLREAGILFGFSAMVTRQNVAVLGGEAFVDEMIACGCRIGFCVGYVPSGNGADLDWVPTPQEQAWFRERVLDLRRRKRLILIHLPDDEYERGGTCMAAGRGFVHINAQGCVEPCPFAHVASDSVRTKSLEEALRAPLLEHIRTRPELLSRPQMGCALFERREELKAVASKLGARPTDVC